MADESGFGGGGFGFGQPGARTTRTETITTEVWMPALQALVRIGTDVLAGVLALLVLLLLGRWVAWALVGLCFFSEWYQTRADRLLSRFVGPPATALEVLLWAVQWGWIIGGGLVVLNVIFPVTWTLDRRMLIQTAELAPVYPFLFWRAAWVDIAFPPFWRLVALIAAAAPLFTWHNLRDRMAWSIAEFTPFAPVNPEMGIDPRKWRKESEPEVVRGAGVIIERVDREPNTTEVAGDVWISNGNGGHIKRIHTDWVTEEQWRAVARGMLVLNLTFTEDNFGKGKVFPTHGPQDKFGNRLGFRLFKQQLLDGGYLTHRGDHPNEGFELTPEGIEKLRKWLDQEGSNE